MLGQMLLSLHGVLKPINIAPLNARNGQADQTADVLAKVGKMPRAVSGVAAHGQFFAPAAERQSSAGSAAPGECGLRRQEKRCCMCCAG